MTDKQYNKLRSYCRKQKISDDDLQSALVIVYTKYTVDKITDNLIYTVARNLKNEQYRKNANRYFTDIDDLSEALQVKLNLVETIDIEPITQLYITDEQAELYKAIQEAFPDDSYYTCFKLYLSGAKMTTLSKKLGISYTRVYNRVRAVSKFVKTKYNITLKCLK